MIRQNLGQNLLLCRLFLSCLCKEPPCCPLVCIAAAGRYLNDVWVLDTARLTWCQLFPVAAKRVGGQPPPGAAGGGGGASAGDKPQANGTGGVVVPGMELSLAPMAGHSVTAWGDRLLVVGGHVKVSCCAAVDIQGRRRWHVDTWLVLRGGTAGTAFLSSPCIPWAP